MTDLAQRYREAKIALCEAAQLPFQTQRAAAEAEPDAVVKLAAIELAEWAAHATALRIDLTNSDIDAGPDSLEIADCADALLGLTDASTEGERDGA